MISKYYKNYSIFRLMNCLSALFAGVIFYLLGRIDFLYGLGIQTKNILLTISFYLPDALWAYALFFALLLIHKSYVSALITFFTSICWEILQFFDIVNGTFDLIDILMYLMAILTAIIINKLWRKKNEKNNT